MLPWPPGENGLKESHNHGNLMGTCHFCERHETDFQNCHAEFGMALIMHA